MSLIKNNAKVAAEIAVALGKEEEVDGHDRLSNNVKQNIPVVIGGSIVDIHYRVLDDKLEVSYPGTWQKLQFNALFR